MSRLTRFLIHVRAYSYGINSDAYCVKYGAMKSSKNGNLVLRKLSVSSRQRQKLSRQNCLLNLNGSPYLHLNNVYIFVKCLQEWNDAPLQSAYCPMSKLKSSNR